MNHKSIYVLAMALVLGTTYALASPGNDGCIGNCPSNGGGTPTEVTNTNTNSNDSTAVSGSVSSSNSDSASSATGGNATVGVGVGVKAGATAVGGSSHAQGGAGGNSESYAQGGAGGSAGALSQVGDTKAIAGDSVSGAHSGDVAVSIQDNSSVAYDVEHAASSAAAVYAQVCQSGGSAQGKAGGFSVINSEPLCEHLKMAAVMREAYVWEMNHGEVVCQEPMEGDAIGVFTHSDTCYPRYAQRYLDSYHEHMMDAMELIDKTEELGLVDKAAGYLVRPMALIGALIWLI